MHINLSRMVGYLLLCGICCGFRVYDKEKPWTRISATNATSAKIFVVYPGASRTLKNDLPSGDPLAGSSPITVAAAMSSIFDDYNSIQGAYLTLVSDSDADFGANSSRRTVYIYERSAGGLNGGEAGFKLTDGEVERCEISLTGKVFDSARSFIATTTHEIGHCMGLDHPQDSILSIMSYFHPDTVVRLQSDDKMALIFLYPVDSSKAKEDATLGLACARRQ